METEDAIRIAEAAILRMQQAAKTGRGVRLSAEEVWALAGIGPLCQAPDYTMPDFD